MSPGVRRMPTPMLLPMMIARPNATPRTRRSRPCRRAAGTVSGRATKVTPDVKVTLLGAADLPDLRRQAGYHLEQIADDAVVRDLEDRRVLVPVDGDDGLGRAHAREMLDGTGDTDRDVEIRTHQSARLPDLVGGRPPAVVSDCAGRADRGVADGS